MDSVLSFIRYLRRNVRIVTILILINLIISVFVLVSVRKPTFRAEATVVINTVKSTFNDNLALDHLLMQKEFTDFIHLIASDTLTQLAAVEFNLAEHYHIPTDHPERIKVASEELRRHISFVSDLPTLVVYHSDEDEQLAEEVLFYLIDQVKNLQRFRIDKNQQVTSELASVRVAKIDSSTALNLKQLDAMYADAKRTPARAKLRNTLLDEMANDIIERQNVEDVRRRIDELSAASGYDLYYVINNGVEDRTYKWSLLLVLAVTANIVVLILELQVLFLIWYVRLTGRNKMQS